MLGFLVIVMTVLLFKTAGEMEAGDRIGGGHGTLCAVLSVGLWALALLWLHWGIVGGLLLQVGLFAGMTAWNVVRSGRKRATRSEP